MVQNSNHNRRELTSFQLHMQLKLIGLINGKKESPNPFGMRFKPTKKQD